MAKTDDKKTASAPEGDAPPTSTEPKLVAADGLTHYWSAQCAKCHTVGNMRAKIDPKDGLVCASCLATAPSPVTVES